jgi:hypothetical protein
MSHDETHSSAWRVGFTAAGAVITVVAALLLAIIAVARSILASAERIAASAQQIADQTQPIWALETTNVVAIELAEGAQAIEGHAREIADALEGGAGS